MAGAGFSNSDNKDLVRNSWNTPLLRYIHSEHNIKFRYLGLPGKDILDVLKWKDMIESVIAFESEEDTAELEAAFQRISMPAKVYSGPMEATLIQGEDIENQEYVQNQLITLYNLDFCDRITGIIPDGQGDTCLRFESLRILFGHERDVYMRNGTEQIFVLLLTVHEGYHRPQIRDYFNGSNTSAEARAFLTSAVINEEYNAMHNKNAKPAVLKAFLRDMLATYFGANQISPVFLPLVRYRGGKYMESPLVHLTVICKINPRDSVVPEQIQSPQEFLGMQTLRANGNTIKHDALPNAVNHFEPNPVEFFRSYEGRIFG